jgi:hypothetical protein
MLQLLGMRPFEAQMGWELTIIGSRIIFQNASIQSYSTRKVEGLTKTCLRYKTDLRASRLYSPLLMLRYQIPNVQQNLPHHTQHSLCHLSLH